MKKADLKFLENFLRTHFSDGKVDYVFVAYDRSITEEKVKNGEIDSIVIGDGYPFGILGLFELVRGYVRKVMHDHAIKIGVKEGTLN